MTSGRFHDREVRARGRPASDADSALGDLDAAAEHYRALRERWDEQGAELAAALERAAHLEAELAHERARVTRRRDEARRQRERTAKLREAVKSFHASLFRGGLHVQLLHACLSITGARRGIYVTANGPGGKLRVRAAAGMDGYPTRRPSPYLEWLCRRAIAERRTAVCNGPEQAPDGPAPGEDGERFGNYLVAPVVVLSNLDGVVIVADKSGDFDEGDVETLLSVGDEATVAEENVRQEHELQHAYLAAVSMLADAVEAKDPYTHGHCEEVSRYARLTARRLGLPERDVSVTCYAALLHDVGKIAVSDGVLHKAGPLLPEEMELVRSHVRVGHDLLRGVPGLASVADVVLHHHERWDGDGYPDALVGERIPVAARIVAVVDSYCAMRDRRPYKDPLGDAAAREELRRCAGRQFDPAIVEAFLAALDMPESDDDDDDDYAECGLLPVFLPT
ncbi:MAG: HD domain-containing phosphohydrolase [Gemmatimonadaceae bacterium]